MKLTAIDILNKENLPVNFANQLIGANAEDTLERIQTFKKEWLKAIDEEVNKRLKTTPPKAGNGSSGEASMNDIIRNMARRR